MFSTLLSIVEAPVKVATGVTQSTVGLVTDPILDTDHVEGGMERLEKAVEDIINAEDD